MLPVQVAFDSRAGVAVFEGCAVIWFEFVPASLTIRSSL